MATTVENTIRTLADLLDRLGRVPPERIRFRPLPGTATERDVLDIAAREKRSLKANGWMVGPCCPDSHVR